MLLQPVDTVQSDTAVSDSTVYWYQLIGATDTDDLRVEYRESLFAGNGHTVQTAEPQLRTDEKSNDWIFGALTLLTALICLYINRQRFNIKDILLSMLDIRVMERVSRESNIRRWSLMPMTGIYVASLALLALGYQQMHGAFVAGQSDVILFLVSLAAIVLYFLCRNSLVYIFGVLFDDPAPSQLYITNNHLFHFLGALCLPPLLLLFFFNGALRAAVLKIAIALVAIIFIIRLLRGMQLILTNSKNSRLYLFYYFCVFEIVPILVMAKILFQ